MAKNKSTYVAGKKLRTARFDSPNRQERLTITLQEGKNRFNLKASIKQLTEDAPKAQTGARESFDTIEKGQKAFDTLVKAAAEKHGWNEISQSVGSRNAFVELPDAPTKGARPSAAKPAHSQPTK
jgi:hypothetical protein